MTITKWFLRIVGLFHLIVGILGSLSDALYLKIMAIAWQATVDLTPQFAFTTKLMSAYVIGFALLVLFISIDPVKYRTFMLIPIFVISLEFLQSIFRYELVNSIFSIAPINTTINLAISLLLIIGFIFIYRRVGMEHAK